MAQNVGPTLILNIDATGTSEARPCKFDFSKDPLILANDTLTTTNLNLSQQYPSGQGTLTFGTATLSGSTITAEVSITNGVPNNKYMACCRTQTAAGYTVEAFVPVVLEGPGFQALGSPAPSIGGQSGTVTSTTGVVQSMTLSQGLVQASVTTGPVTSAQMVATGITAGNQGDASHVPVANVDAAGRLVSWTNTPMVVKDSGGQVFNVQASPYNAKGDGVTDDTTAIQNAITDALAVGGQVFFPPPASTYKVTSSINIGGSAGHQQTVSMRAPPIQSNHTGGLITYSGSSNSSVFILLGITDWCFENIGVTITSGISNVVVWDQQYNLTYGNSGLSKFIKCNTVFSGNLNCIWVRLGQASNLNSNGYNIKFYDCVCNDQTTNSGTIAVQIGGSQHYSPTFLDCTFTCSCNILVGPISSTLTGSVTQNVSTTVPVADTLLYPSSGTISIGGNTATYTSKSTSTGPGNLVLASTWTAPTFNSGSLVNQYVTNQGVYIGNCSFHFKGGELAGNSWGYDVLILTGGYCSFDTLQCQNVSAVQRRWLQVGLGAASTPVHVQMKAITLKNYLPVSTVDTHGLIWLHYNTTLEMERCTINNGTTAFSSTSSAWLISNNGGSGFGSIRLKDCDFFATFPFIDNSALAVGWPISYQHVQLTNNQGSPQSVLNNDPRLYRTITAASYTVTTGNDYTIACNCTSNAIAVNLPSAATVPAGWTYVVKKTDSSANAATVTPNGTDKIDGAATFSLATQYKFVRITTDGVSAWNVMGSN